MTRKNDGISLVALTTWCVTRMAGLLAALANSALQDVAFRYAQTLGRIQQEQRFRSSISFRAGQSVPTFHPRYLSVYASTRLLPDALQHSILSLGLGATQTGVSPASCQTISSTHVHVMVLPFYSLPYRLSQRPKYSETIFSPSLFTAWVSIGTRSSVRMNFSSTSYAIAC